MCGLGPPGEVSTVSAGPIAKLLFKMLDLLVRHLVEIHKGVAGASGGLDERIVHDLRLLPLSIGLPQDEDPEEVREDRGRGIDQELPRVAEA